MLTSFLMLVYRNKLLLALLLLLSQTTAMSHDVQHLGSAHGELCAVYLSQDHSALTSVVVTTPVFNGPVDCYQDVGIEIDVPSRISPYTSRAPPKN